MNKLYTLPAAFGLVFCSHMLSAQSCQSSPTAQTDLAGNAITARITTGGDLWWNGDDAAYLVNEAGPGAPQPSAVFAGGLWLFGTDPGGGIKGAAQQYGRATGRFDYGPGPLSQDGVSDPDCANWDRFWPITSEEIRNYLNVFDPDNPDISAIPANILNWPAVGNPHFAGIFGFELPSTPQGLAPFWDEDLDGFYDPMNGDYPLFCGDQAVWCVFNDAVLHQQSGIPNILQMEVRLLAYSFNTDDEALNQSTFYHYTLVNRGAEDIIDFYAGLWIDFDLGCYTDDAFGAIPEDNLVYVHNNSSFDTEPCVGSITSFQTPGVVQIAQVVHSSLADDPFNQDTLLAAAPSFNNSGIGSSIPATTEPRNAIEYYNYMQGLWRDGTPITRGGNGYQSGTEVTPYAFDGGVDNIGNEWDACTANLPFSDRRSVMSTGPYPALQPGAVVDFTVAMTTILNVDQDAAGCPDKAAIVTAAREIKEVYDSSCSSEVLNDPTSITSYAAFPVSIFPNPTHGETTFRVGEGHSLRKLEVFNALGQLQLLRSVTGNTVAVDLTAGGLAQGTYFYRLTDTVGDVVAGKLVLK